MTKIIHSNPNCKNSVNCTPHNEIGDVYKIGYAWIVIVDSFITPKEYSDDKIFCAWCNKARSEIKNPKKHIDEHINSSWV